MHRDARKIREKWAAGEAVIGPFVQMPAAGVITGVLLEGREAYEAIDEFFAIEGLDLIKIAPYDLSRSFGVPGDIYHPTVIAAVEEICAKVEGSGMVVGTFSEEPERAATWVAAGARFISTDVDSQILYQASCNLVSQYRVAFARGGSGIAA